MRPGQRGSGRVEAVHAGRHASTHTTALECNSLQVNKQACNRPEMFGQPGSTGEQPAAQTLHLRIKACCCGLGVHKLGQLGRTNGLWGREAGHQANGKYESTGVWCFGARRERAGMECDAACRGRGAKPETISFLSLHHLGPLLRTPQVSAALLVRFRCLGCAAAAAVDDGVELCIGYRAPRLGLPSGGGGVGRWWWLPEGFGSEGGPLPAELASLKRLACGQNSTPWAPAHPPTHPPPPGRCGQHQSAACPAFPPCSCCLRPPCPPQRRGSPSGGRGRAARHQR